MACFYSAPLAWNPTAVLNPTAVDIPFVRSINGLVEPASLALVVPQNDVS
jgi:hypothetical protein